MRKDNQDAFVKKHGIKMGFMSAFVKASAYALTKQPTVNAVIDGQETVYRDFVDISVAVATPKVIQILYCHVTWFRLHTSNIFWILSNYLKNILPGSCGARLKKR